MPVSNSAYQELRITAAPSLKVDVPVYVTINSQSGKNLTVGAYFYPSKSLLMGATFRVTPHLYFYCTASFAHPNTSLPITAIMRDSRDYWFKVDAIFGMSGLLPVTANFASSYKIYTTASMASSCYDDIETTAYFPLSHDLPTDAILVKKKDLLCSAAMTIYHDMLIEAIIANHSTVNLPCDCTFRSSGYHDLNITAQFKGVEANNLTAHLNIRKRTFTDFPCTVSIRKTDKLKAKITIKNVYSPLSNIKIVLVRTLGQKQRYIHETLTDDNGYFTFNNIPAGNYNIVPVNSEYYFMPKAHNIIVNQNINNLEFYAFDEFTTPIYNNYAPSLYYNNGYTISGQVIYIACNNLLFACAFDYEGVNNFTNNFIKYKL